VATLHRPENVDDPRRAEGLLSALAEVARLLPLVFAVHPRTRERLRGLAAWRRLASTPGLRTTPSLGYVEFLRLVEQSALVLTDSGGLQEETTVLGVPCLTLRDTTERPVTVERGTNRVVGTLPAAIVAVAQASLGVPATRAERWAPIEAANGAPGSGAAPPAAARDGAADAACTPRSLLGDFADGARPELWDGFAAERIADVLVEREAWIKGRYRRLRERTPWRRTTSAA
jgi:UDP-N-acetylglucosamine 2-epimerase (non-hydrolysing)